ncbi:aldehyde dehydrogenase family protein [Bradyrhizobium sp. 76]|nr:aldehyde dehydrogenase family protein [Bradyrhizobium sp. 76]
MSRETRIWSAPRQGWRDRPSDCRGQKCSACSVVYVDNVVKQEFIGKLVNFSSRLVVGDPRRAETFMRPVYVTSHTGCRQVSSPATRMSCSTSPTPQKQVFSMPTEPAARRPGHGRAPSPSAAGRRGAAARVASAHGFSRSTCASKATRS